MKTRGFTLYIKEMDVVHVVTYPSRSSTPEYAAGYGPFKQPRCSKCSALSPLWSTSCLLWQTEAADACGQLGPILCSSKLLQTCRSEARQSSCNSSHMLPGKQQRILVFVLRSNMLMLTELGISSILKEFWFSFWFLPSLSVILSYPDIPDSAPLQKRTPSGISSQTSSSIGPSLSHCWRVLNVVQSSDQTGCITTTPSPPIDHVVPWGWGVALRALSTWGWMYHRGRTDGTWYHWWRNGAFLANCIIMTWSYTVMIMSSLSIFNSVYQ